MMENSSHGPEQKEVQLTPRELEIIIAWRGEPFFPDEMRVLKKLEKARALGSRPLLSRLQVEIVRGWAEEQVAGHYGGGEVRLPEEEVIIRKLQDSLNGT